MNAIDVAETMGWPAADGRQQLTVGLFQGEGIGPELTSLSVRALQALTKVRALPLDLRHGGLIGKPAKHAHGQCLTPEAIELCDAVFAERGAILCGPGGDRFVYDLRKHFDLYAKYTPIRPFAEVADAGVVRQNARDGVDFVVVRENTGGLYQGKWSTAQSDRETTAHHALSYSASQVKRILQVGLALALRRRRRLTMIVKAGGVPSISELWSRTLDSLRAEYAVECSELDVDNAAYQLIANARAFDVIVAPNMFGDVLSDAAALLLGSRGLSFSANFGVEWRAVYQTGHGAAHDLAGKDVANPSAQLLSLAMMLREHFGLMQEAHALETALARVLGQGIRTADLLVQSGSTGAGRVVGLQEFGQCVIEAAVANLASGRSPEVSAESQRAAPSSG
jgi:3-isopropylmalate dehydrogenase